MSKIKFIIDYPIPDHFTLTTVFDGRTSNIDKSTALSLVGDSETFFSTKARFAAKSVEHYEYCVRAFEKRTA